jgi:NAD-dependent SIR2 family protein deacetylase
VSNASESIYNRAAIKAAKDASCFHCLRTYPAAEVIQWCDKGNTAICPHCGSDAVIAGILNSEVLRVLNARWFRPDEAKR